MISSGSLSWLAQNLGIWFRNRECRLPHFELASAECSILCLLLNMCSRCSVARCQTEPLAVAWTGSPTASPKSSEKLASSRHPEHGQRLTGYVGYADVITGARTGVLSLVRQCIGINRSKHPDGISGPLKTSLAKPKRICPRLYATKVKVNP